MSSTDVAVIPAEKDRRKLRACLLCGLIKSSVQFKTRGCENCEELLHMKDSSKRVNSCTSGNFEGMIAQLRPERSWVSRWQRTDKFVRGMYAIRVAGRLPIEVQEMLSDSGVKYRPRDGSVKD